MLQVPRLKLRSMSVAVTPDAAISALGAPALVDTMPRLHSLTVITINAASSTWITGMQWLEALALLDSLPRRRRDGFTSSAAFSTCEKDMLHMVLLLLDTMSRLHGVCNIAINDVISAASTARKEALALQDSMRRLCGQITINAAINAWQTGHLAFMINAAISVCEKSKHPLRTLARLMVLNAPRRMTRSTAVSTSRRLLPV